MVDWSKIARREERIVSYPKRTQLNIAVRIRTDWTKSTPIRPGRASAARSNSWKIMRNVERRCFDQQGERMRENKRKARENEGTIQASTAKNRSSENENYEASIEKK